ncbi:ABC transporter permease [Gordonia sp. (in: high G+C Gram-positive bacteria)]|uniref:ABC transporter permease n=1 Tax=Gordonia sp. (in: high G+C Gram-positive bacteria) TaxID=84139 RepID=UPI003C71C80A
MPFNVSAATTIASLEIRQRIRSTKWKWTLGILFALISLLILGSLGLTLMVGGTYAAWSRFLFDLALGIVLFLGLVAAPTMSATSINGDRRDATLAVIQATPITSTELAVGKWLGSWLASLALIAVAAPYLLWGVFTGPVSLLGAVLGIVVLAILLGCYCAIGLGFSSLTARPAASAMLTQSTVLLLLVGLPILFGMTLPLVTQSHEVTTSSHSPETPGECTNAQVNQDFLHTERTWWLLAANPLLIVSDAIASGVERGPAEYGESASSLPAAGLSIARSGPYLKGSVCLEEYGDYRYGRQVHETRFIGTSWYIGLIFNMVLGALGLSVASRRLRVPAHKLAKGVRVA